MALLDQQGLPASPAEPPSFSPEDVVAVALSRPIAGPRGTLSVWICRARSRRRPSVLRPPSPCIALSPRLHRPERPSCCHVDRSCSSRPAKPPPRPYSRGGRAAPVPVECVAPSTIARPSPSPLPFLLPIPFSSSLSTPSPSLYQVRTGEHPTPWMASSSSPTPAFSTTSRHHRQFPRRRPTSRSPASCPAISSLVPLRSSLPLVSPASPA